MSSTIEAVAALASRIEATVKWESSDHPFAPDAVDADWLRGFMTLDPAKAGGFGWTAWGYGSPCPEGTAPTPCEAKAAACYAMAESFIRAAAAHGVAVSVMKGGE